MYDEKLTDMIFFSEETNSRVAFEFVINGFYKATDSDLPEGATSEKFYVRRIKLD